MVKPPMDHVVELVYILTRLVKNLAKCSYYTTFTKLEKTSLSVWV